VRISTTPRRSGGFTLVELMVSMALIILIMSILAQGFAEGTKIFREAKAIGDLQENLRIAVVRLRDDLILPHFDANKKLSEGFQDYSRPAEGFVRIQQGAAPTGEGNDGDGLPSFRATTDILHLTIAGFGDRRESYFSASAPATGPGPAGNAGDRSQPLWNEGPSDYRQAGFMNSKRLEVMWFLVPMFEPGTGAPMLAGSGATPLFALHRRQRLGVTDNNAPLNTLPPAQRIPANTLGQFPEIACLPDKVNAGVLYFPTLKDLATPSLRSMMDATGTSSMPDPYGAPRPPIPTPLRDVEIIIPDVISFEIKVVRPNDFQFKDIRTIQGEMGLAQTGVYDTATWPVNDPTIPGNANKNDIRLTLRGIQITLRVWDSRTEQARQVTMIQDL